MREPLFRVGHADYYLADCIDWLGGCEPRSIHGVVTDPPYGLLEYTKRELAKRKRGTGGVWRIPPSFDGHERAPLPRFTVLSDQDRISLSNFFEKWGKALLPALVPGAHILVACNPLLSALIATSLATAGLERRGQIIRLVMTMRGGDRPKGAHEEYADVTVMPRSMHEAWLLFRSPLEGRVQDNLRKWKTGGLRRPSADRPFGDVIASAPTHKAERALAEHPSLKPQAFLRQVVRAILPLGEGTVLDPFAGSGSTLAACEYLRERGDGDYNGIGVELDTGYAAIAEEAIPRLTAFQPVNGVTATLAEVQSVL